MDTKYIKCMTVKQGERGFFGATARMSDEFNILIEDAQKVKSINGGATRYSNANTKEWFAENFSLYIWEEELVDPKFIEFLENEVLK